MSRPSLPAFTWPVIAPGSQENPTLSFSTSQAKKTVYVTVTTTIVSPPAADASNAPMIYQTQPLDLHDSVLSTEIRTPVPEVTVASFDFFTPPAEVGVSIEGNPTPTESNSSPTPNSSSILIPTPPPSTLSPAAIVGITLGIVALVGALAALAGFLYYRCKAKKTKADSEAPKPKETLEETIARGRELQRKRWSARETALNHERFERLKAKLAARNNDIGMTKVDETFVVGDGEEDKDAVKKETPIVTRTEAACRPSGLAMHPPTPLDADPKVGRAV